MGSPRQVARFLDSLVRESQSRCRDIFESHWNDDETLTIIQRDGMTLGAGKRVLVTVTDLPSEDPEAELRTAQLLASQQIISTIVKGAHGARGIVVCPRCGGTLHYSTAECNGHIHAHCEKEGCLRWCE